jgi:phthiocerol/phenolphthiocerol synthesis type-I polyketide synthase E
MTTEQVAIIGAELLLPGANSIATFWHNIVGGRNRAEAAPLEAKKIIANRKINDPDGGAAQGAPVSPFDLFDHDFFDYAAEEAQSIDPQQRVLLTLAHRLLEHIGVCTDNIGTFVCTDFPCDLPEDRLAASDIVAENGSECAATRIAQKLDLRGPAMSIKAGRSSALLALHTARIAILTGQCQMALVGAASLQPPLQDGSRPNSGAIIIGLKSLSAALRDGSEILGLIRGSAIDEDAPPRTNVAALPAEHPSDAILKAYRTAGVAPDTVGYMEVCGTCAATDAAGTQALITAFRSNTARQEFCALGSVVNNIGRIGVATSLASVLKAVLCLKHRVKPPCAGDGPSGFHDLLQEPPFYIPAVPVPWAASAHHPRRASIAGSGKGDLVHVVIEEGVARSAQSRVDTGPLLISAKTVAALGVVERGVRYAITEDPAMRGDLRYTSQLCRRHYAERGALVFPRERLRLAEVPRLIRPTHDWSDARVALLFHEQGRHYSGMGSEHYARGGHFRATFDDCADRFVTAGCQDPRQFLEDPLAVFDEADRQIYLFTLEYSLGALFAAARMPIVAALGHEVGEYVAATLAGVFRLRDAIGIVAAWARIAGRQGGTVSSRSRGVEFDDFRSALDDIKLGVPSFRLITGPGDDELRGFTRADHWIRHLRSPVRFEACLSRLVSMVRYDVGIDAGPSGSKSSANRSSLATPHAVDHHFQSLTQDQEAERVDTVLAQAWANNMPIDWEPLYDVVRGNIVSVPPHPLLSSRRR